MDSLERLSYIQQSIHLRLLDRLSSLSFYSHLLLNNLERLRYIQRSIHLRPLDRLFSLSFLAVSF